MLNQFRRRATPVALLICLAFIAMRMSGVHEHRHVRMADAVQAMPVALETSHADQADHHHAVHWQEAAHSEDNADSIGHQDIEVPALTRIGDKLSKQLEQGWAVLLTAIAIWLLFPRARIPRPDYRSPPRRSPRASLHPPLRGPPAIIFG